MLQVNNTTIKVRVIGNFYAQILIEKPNNMPALLYNDYSLNKFLKSLSAGDYNISVTWTWEPGSSYYMIKEIYAI